MSIQFQNFQIAGASPANNVAAVVGSAISGLQEFSRAEIQANIRGATGDTLNLIVQTSYDGKHVGDATKKWFDLAAFAQLAAGAAAADFLITLIRSSTGAAPLALTQGTMTQGTLNQTALGDALRLFAVPGAATSAGALQTLTIGMFLAA